MGDNGTAGGEYTENNERQLKKGARRTSCAVSTLEIENVRVNSLSSGTGG
jgi:hypothetical protein